MKETRKTPENMEVFNTILMAFGDQDERCQIHTYQDDAEKNWIDIVICPDCPTEQVISYATITLSDFSIGSTAEDVPLGVEILAAIHQKWSAFANILAACAFNIIIDQANCSPGMIFLDVVEAYHPEVTMKHILFVPPFGWQREFETLKFDSKYVAWLLAVPISEVEFQYAQANGTKLLQALFQEKQINIYDLNRDSVV
jgi:hypothetical protein